MSLDPQVTPGPEVVLHRERLAVDWERDVVRAVVRRRIVTETRQVQVAVRREVLEVEYLPVAADQRGAEPAPAPEPVVLVLSEEVPVVSLVARPYERVVVDVATVQEPQVVRAELSEERVDVSRT